MNFKEYINNEMFQPGILGMFINPFYFARKGLYENIKELGTSLTGKTLDVGCGTKPYENLFKSSEYIGLEIDTNINKEKSKADFYYDGKKFPFKDKEFDSLAANQVLEHVFNPNEFLKEVNRVAKPGAYFLLTVPFVWDEHEQPYDFARYSSFGLEAILKDNGFEIITKRKSLADLRVIFQLINGYFYKKTAGKKFYLKQIATICIMAPVNLVGSIIAKIFPSNEDLYLDNVILARKIRDV